ncbi:MAG: hypothetical protein IAE97_13640 [Chthoniobacterales bacterium]|nr:hypothetical protein [Chthoniobacterales bacterium]
MDNENYRLGRIEERLDKVEAKTETIIEKITDLRELVVTSLANIPLLESRITGSEKQINQIKDDFIALDAKVSTIETWRGKIVWLASGATVLLTWVVTTILPRIWVALGL